MKLTEKQKLFVTEYLVDLNATQAAIRAKYSPNTAQRIGSENLSKPLIAAAIAVERERLKSDLDITPERVLKELAALAFVDMSQAYNADGHLLNIHDMPEDVRRCISGFELESHDKLGITTYTKKIKNADKKGALELLGKHLALFTDRIEHSGSINLTKMSDDELEKIVKGE